MDTNGTGYAYSYLNPHPANRYADSAADRWPNGNYRTARGGWMHVLRCEGGERHQPRHDISDGMGDVQPGVA